MTNRVEHLAEGVTLYLGDCREILPTLGRFDACVTDPPYGIRSGIVADRPTKWQRIAGQGPESWDESIVQNLPAIVACGNKQAIWGGNYYPLTPSRGWLSWFKPDAPPSMGSVELAWTNIDQNPRQISCSIAATNAERVGHPTQKPLAVMLFTLREIGHPKTVFDPFMGSGTTGVAAVKLGLSFTGVEIDPKYFAMACRRISDELSRPTLFVDRPAAIKQEVFEL